MPKQRKKEGKAAISVHYIPARPIHNESPDLVQPPAAMKTFLRYGAIGLTLLLDYRAEGPAMSLHHVFRTTFGFCGIAWSERGIIRFILPMEIADAVEQSLIKGIPHSSGAEPSGQTAEAVAATRRYFDGKREDFSALPVDLTGVDPFRRAVYEAARCLGYGKTTTYGALAAEAGFPQAARETGTALGRNPIPLIIPCHRILAAGGKLGGFSAPGGTTTKRRMLALEGAAAPGAEPAQASFAF